MTFEKSNGFSNIKISSKIIDESHKIMMNNKIEIALINCFLARKGFVLQFNTENKTCQKELRITKPKKRYIKDVKSIKEVIS